MTNDNPSPPPDFLPSLERVLRKRGLRLHAFRSGGGLRVVRIERVASGGRRGSLVGYGEHPSLEHAMAHAAEDHDAGGRPYGKVYGSLYPHYLTGSSTASSDADAAILRGGSMDAWYERGWFRVEFDGYVHNDYPAGYVERAQAGETVEWSSPRGVRYRFEPMGSGGCTIRVLCGPPGLDGSFWPVRWRGMGLTLAEAMADALRSEPEEVERCA